MLGYYQKTESEVALPLPDGSETCSDNTVRFWACLSGGRYGFWTQPSHAAHFFIQPKYETIGGSPFGKYILQCRDSLDWTRTAWNAIRQAENREVARVARRLLYTIQQVLLLLEQLGLDLHQFPPLHALNVDDGSILIEWIFADFRIGFSVEPEPEESGWYLVSNGNLGRIGASGYTSNVNVKALVLWLVSFALSNS